METLAVDIIYTVSNALTELRARLIHSQENACNLQIRIESVLNIFHHFQYIRNSFTCKEMCLHWNNAIIGSGECVDGQKLMFQPAVNNNVVILFVNEVNKVAIIFSLGSFDAPAALY